MINYNYLIWLIQHEHLEYCDIDALELKHMETMQIYILKIMSISKSD